MLRCVCPGSAGWPYALQLVAINGGPRHLLHVEQTRVWWECDQLPVTAGTGDLDRSVTSLRPSWTPGLSVPGVSATCRGILECVITDRALQPRDGPAAHDSVANMQVKPTSTSCTVDVGGSGPSGPTPT